MAFKSGKAYGQGIASKTGRHYCPRLMFWRLKWGRGLLDSETHLKEAYKHEEGHIQALQHNGTKQLGAEEPRAQEAQCLTDETQ